MVTRTSCLVLSAVAMMLLAVFQVPNAISGSIVGYAPLSDAEAAAKEGGQFYQFFKCGPRVTPCPDGTATTSSTCGLGNGSPGVCGVMLCNSCNAPIGTLRTSCVLGNPYTVCITLPFFNGLNPRCGSQTLSGCTFMPGNGACVCAMAFAPWKDTSCYFDDCR